jgi:microcin C transport system substrate-binding protein
MNKKISIIILLLVGMCFLLPANVPAQNATTSHGIALFGDLMYKADFKNFNYVNPDAPKGGTMVQAVNNFDNINPYIATGTNMFPFGGINGAIAELLMAPSLDEPNSVYGLIAESVTYPADNSWIEFKIRNIARWNDGKPITPEDVIFTYEALKTKGAPTFASYFAEVTTVEKKGNDSVRFTFSRGGDRNLIYRLASAMPVFAKHYWEKRDFEQPTLEVPVMSGPYKIKIDVGNSMTLERVKDYWGKDLPVNRGRYNLDMVRLDVYRDMNVSYEAFMAGNVDIRAEQTLSTWKTGYDVSAVRKGFIQKKEYKPKGSMMFLGIGMNGRRDKFKNQKTREALAYAFDWEWTNKTIYYSMYSRIRSYFENTELANEGLPKGAELRLLEPFRKRLDPRVFTEPFNPPKTDGTQASLRNNLRQASRLLKEAGWVLNKGKLYDKKGKLFEIEIILLDPTQEPMFAPYVENLKLLGVSAKMAILDSATFWPRYFQYDWDMVQNGLFPHSLSPGAEFRDFWGSKSADAPTSFNGQGIKNPVVDALIEKVIAAKDRPSKIAACQALDRVLCWNYYSIPLWYWNSVLFAYWDRFGFPKNLPKWTRTPSTDIMWLDKDKDAAVSKVRGSSKK